MLDRLFVFPRFVFSRFTPLPIGVRGGLRCLSVALPRNFFISFFELQYTIQIFEPAHEIMVLGDRRRLRRACASAQSHQSLRCSRT